MKCPECDASVVRDARFCHQCGTSIEIASKEDAAFHTRSGLARDKPASLLRARQGDDAAEATLWSGTFSAKSMIGLWVLASVLTVVLLAGGILLAATQTQWLGILGVVAAVWLGLLLLLGVRKLNVHYELTNQRLIHKTGILRRRTDRIEAIDMDDVGYEQGILERLIGVGTICVTSSDRTHPNIVLPGVDRVHEVANLLDDARRKERLRRGLHIESV